MAWNARKSSVLGTAVLTALVSAGMATGAALAAPGLIAFAADVPGAVGGASRIYLANDDGTQLHPVTSGAGRERSPALAPDGRALAYQSSDALGDSIWIQPLDAARKPVGAPRRLARGASPQWSRDGKRVLFARVMQQARKSAIFVIAADGSQSEDALQPIAEGIIARWSEDGKRLAVIGSEIVGGEDRWQIRVLDVGGKTPKLKLNLAPEFGQTVSLDWSPDGQTLLFSAAQGSQAPFGLYAIKLQMPDQLVRLPQPGAAMGIGEASFGAWSPDGKQILFRSGAGGSAGGGASRLHMMDADGKNPHLFWEPMSGTPRINGTDWIDPTAPQVNNPPAPPPTNPTPPMPPAPMPMPAPQRVLSPAKQLLAAKVRSVPKPSSPLSVLLLSERNTDFVITVPLLASQRWIPRRQGVGVTLEMVDGSLYRGTVIHSDGPWATIQGRRKGERVRMIDGKKLVEGTGGFEKGFVLTVRREGPKLTVVVGDQEILSRPLITSGVKSLALTLENFDPGTARFELGAVTFQEWVDPNAPEVPLVLPVQTAPPAVTPAAAPGAARTGPRRFRRRPGTGTRTRTGTRRGAVAPATNQR